MHAWLRFNDAIDWAKRTHESEREQFAREHASALRRSVSWLVLSAPGELEARVDGKSVRVRDAGELDSAPPRDSGATSHDAGVISLDAGGALDAGDSLDAGGGFDAGVVDPGSTRPFVASTMTLQRTLSGNTVLRAETAKGTR